MRRLRTPIRGQTERRLARLERRVAQLEQWSHEPQEILPRVLDACCTHREVIKELLDDQPDTSGSEESGT